MDHGQTLEIFYGMVLCNSVNWYQCTGGAGCFHLHTRNPSIQISPEHWYLPSKLHSIMCHILTTFTMSHLINRICCLLTLWHLVSDRPVTQYDAQNNKHQGSTMAIMVSLCRSIKSWCQMVKLIDSSDRTLNINGKNETTVQKMFPYM